MRNPPETAQADDPFAGKILVVNERSNPNFGATLEEVHLRRIGDQQFLVGKGFASEEGKGWYNDRVVWVPLSDVSQLTEFQDRGDLDQGPRQSPHVWPVNCGMNSASRINRVGLSHPPAFNSTGSAQPAPRDRASRQ